MNDKEAKQVAADIRDVKMLLILQCLAQGYKQKHIAAALNISEATFSRMMPKGFSKSAGKVAASSVDVLASDSQ